MTDNLDERFQVLEKLCLLLAFQKPRAVEVERKAPRSISVRAHPSNIGQYIGSKGAHFKAMAFLAQNLGFMFEVQDKSDATAFTQFTAPVVAHDVLEDLMRIMAGKAIPIETSKVKDVHKFVCTVPRELFTERLEDALDVIFYAAAFSSGSEKGVVLLPE